jgi:hypothetical protein
MSETPEPSRSPAEASAPRAAEDADRVVGALQRIERQLDAIRGRLESDDRAGQYRHFSLARLIGALLQAMVVVLILASLSDFVFQAPIANLIAKLSFATVLQLGALTAFTIARES